MKNEQKKSKLDRLCWLLSQRRAAVLISFLIITCFFAYGAFHIRGEVQLYEMFPYDHPYLKLTAHFMKIFGGGSSGVVISLQAKNGDIFNKPYLEKLKKMTGEVSLWPEVNRDLTMSIASLGSKAVVARGKGEIYVTPLMYYKTPETAEEMALLKKQIFTSPAYNGTLVATDGTAALLATEFKEDVTWERGHELLQKLVKDYSDQYTSVHIVGFPSLMGWIYSLKSQILFVFVLSIVGMFIILLIIFYGSWVGMISVMFNALTLTIWGLGFVGFTGINFSPLLYVLAFLVGARMIGNAQQITYRYFEELDVSGDRLQACYETMRTMWIPNFAAVAADVCGFAVLFVAKIVLMKFLAIIMSFWMATIILTGLLVPVVCSLIPWKVDTSVWKKETCREDWIARAMMAVTRFSIGPRSRYLVGGVIILVTIFACYELTQLKIGDASPGSPILADDHTYNKDQAMINAKFNRSSESLVLYYEGKPGSVHDPIVLNTFEAFDRYLRERLPDIYKSSLCLNNMIKSVNSIWHDADQAWNQLPRQEHVMQFALAYVRQNLGNVAMAQFVDPEFANGQTVMFFADHTSDNLLRIRDAAYDFFKTRPMKVEKGEFQLAGGMIGLQIALNEEMKKYHLIIDLMIYSALFVILSLIYKSPVAGLMLTLPLILSNALAATYMALKGIGLSVNTLPVFAIGAGVGVDFAIYLYSRAVEEYPLQNGDWKDTITQSICTCGKAVMFTAITVIFPIITWYFFSDFKFQSDVGLFLSIIMLANVILTITLHPLMLYVFKPKFVRRGALKLETALQKGATV